MRILPTLALILSSCSILAQGELAMTYNIRYDNPDDPLKWQARKSDVGALMKTCGIVGVQEALQHQVYDLAASLPEHQWIGVGRDDGKNAGEFAPIFYSSDYELITWKTIWLSPTPKDTASVGWDAALTRIATVAEFFSKGEKLLVINAHFDHQGEKARNESAKIILKEIGTHDVHRMLVMGDFNAKPESACNKMFLGSGLNDQGMKKSDSTFRGFDDSADKRIDYVFSKNIKTLQTTVPALKISDMNISDHLPVILEFE